MTVMKTNEIVASASSSRSDMLRDGKPARKPKRTSFTYSVKGEAYSSKMTGFIRSAEHSAVIDAALFGTLGTDVKLLAVAPELLAELKRLRRAYVHILHVGHGRIIALGGTCDPVAVMEAGDPALRSCDATITLAEASLLDQALERAGGGE